MDLTAFLIRLLIGVGIIWLTQTLLVTFALREPANKIVFLVVVLFMVVFIVVGGSYLPLPK